MKASLFFITKVPKSLFFFNKLNKIYLRAGYLGDNNGSFEETYKTIHMMNKYKKLDTNYDLDEDTKLRYGLPVSEDTKKMILKKI